MNQINDRQKAEILARAQKDLTENRPVIIETDLTTTLAVIGNVQLALRHPLNTGPSSKAAESFIINLIESIDPQHG